MDNEFSALERIVRIVIVVVIVLPILVGLVLWLVTRRLPSSVLEQILIYSLVAAAMSLVMTVDELDLSIGGTVTLAGIVAAELMTANVPALVAVGVTLVFGILVGLLNGVLIALLRLPFYVVTLSMLGLMSGLALILTGSKSIFVPDQPFAGSLLVLLIANLLVYLLGVVVLHLLARSTSLGKLRSLKARSEAAGKPDARALNLYKIAVYMLSGLLAAGAGLALLNMLRAALPTLSNDLTLTVLAGVVLGGATLWKGSTRLLGAFLGSAVIILIRVAVNLLGLSPASFFVPSVLALGAVILYGLAGWVIDLVFSKRKPQPSPAIADAQPKESVSPVSS